MQDMIASKLHQCTLLRTKEIEMHNKIMKSENEMMNRPCEHKRNEASDSHLALRLHSVSVSVCVSMASCLIIQVVRRIFVAGRLHVAQISVLRIRVQQSA